MSHTSRFNRNVTAALSRLIHPDARKAFMRDMERTEWVAPPGNWPFGLLRANGQPDYPFLVRGRLYLRTFGLKLAVERCGKEDRVELRPL